ncbi:cyclin-like protein [Pelagophyceae sp. CCMP2097]|nr:cyclin-like protein [Pelagophyceae sp. CCMP2097]
MLAEEESARAPFDDLTNAQKRKAAELKAKAVRAPRAPDGVLPGLIRNAAQKPKRRRSKPAEPEDADESHYDFDRGTRRDELACADYVVPLYEYYREAEVRPNNRPSVLMYMDFQQDISPKMRAILVDWLIEVHMKFKMTQQTIYLTVHIIDRYLSKCQIGRAQLQLLGVSALFIASKYEEIYPPEISECTYITDHAYDVAQVLAMEMAILRELDWNITAPNAHFWLVRLMRLSRADAATAHRAEYYAQRTLQEYNMLEYKPSMLAAASAHLALVAAQAPGNITAAVATAAWPAELKELTGYAEADLYACCKAIAHHVNLPDSSKANKLAACRKKFAKDDFERVAAAHKCPVLPRRP